MTIGMATSELTEKTRSLCKSVGHGHRHSHASWVKDEIVTLPRSRTHSLLHLNPHLEDRSARHEFPHGYGHSCDR